jgi:DegV family protein with EDD domain
MKLPPTRTAIVTDSTADIPPNLVEEHHIQVVPNIIVIEGESLEDGSGISREEFYTRLPEMKVSPTTATASSGTYQALYERLLQQGYENILSIHTSSLLSGIFNAASVAAQSFGERVRVIDSGYVTMGLGFQVLAAAEAAARGLGLQAIQDHLTDVRKRVRIIAMLDSLEYLRRSGRVSWAKARLGNWLHLKAFVEVKYGRVLSLGEARTRRKGIERLKEFLRNLGPLERLAILGLVNK